MTVSKPALLDHESPEYKAFETYTELIKEKRELEDRLNDIGSQIKTLEPGLLAFLSASGFELVRVNGFTLSPHRDPWVKVRLGCTRSMVCEALKASDLGQYVSEQFNTKSLTKYVHDLEIALQIDADSNGADGRPTVLEHLPPELARVINIEPSFRLQARKR